AGGAVFDDAVEEKVGGIVGLEIYAGLRGRALGVAQQAMVDEQVFGADDADPLSVVGVAVDASDDDVAVGGFVCPNPEVDSVAAGLFDAEVLDVHVATAQEREAVTPFGFVVRGGLVIGFEHADDGEFAGFGLFAPDG